MKSPLILTCLLLLSMTLSSQDAKDILKRSKEKCQSITNGYYEMTSHEKALSGPDTRVSSKKCYFKKGKGKKAYPEVFHLQFIHEGQHASSALFTGEELVTFSLQDSTGIILSVDKWKREVDSWIDNYDFFEPFTSGKSRPMPGKSDYRESSFQMKLVGEENVSGYNCHHIEISEVPTMEKGSGLNLIEYARHFWINTKDMMPVQYSEKIAMVMNKDTMIQYDLVTVDRYELNMPFEEDKVSLSVVPAYIKLKEYTPYVRPEPLPIDTIAPLWSFPSLTEDTVRLEGLKGKLVLLDFFYKSCYPCMQALPALQSLHEKYKDQGLVVIGLDPYDDKEDNLPDFLAKRDVDYTVLYASRDIAKTYRVNGYPTMFLIDKEGKIIHIQEGYGEGTEARLEEIILNNL